jgi:hypothetical protein
MPLDDPVVREYLTVLMYGLPILLMVGRLFFGSWAGFFECLRFLLMPDLVSLLRGEWGADQWATFKLFLFIALCAGAVFSAHGYFYG